MPWTSLFLGIGSNNHNNQTPSPHIQTQLQTQTEQQPTGHSPSLPAANEKPVLLNDYCYQESSPNPHPPAFAAATTAVAPAPAFGAGAGAGAANTASPLAPTPGHASTHNHSQTTTPVYSTAPGHCAQAHGDSDANGDDANETVDVFPKSGQVDCAPTLTSDLDDVDVGVDIQDDYDCDYDNVHAHAHAHAHAHVHDDPEELPFHFQFDELSLPNHPNGQHYASMEVNPAPTALSAMDHSLSATNENVDGRARLDLDPDGDRAQELKLNQGVADGLDEAQTARHTGGHEYLDADVPEPGHGYGHAHSHGLAHAHGAETVHPEQGTHHPLPIHSPPSLPLPRADATSDPCPSTPTATPCNLKHQRGTGITASTTTNTPTHGHDIHEQQERIDNDTRDNEVVTEDNQVNEHGHCATDAVVMPASSTSTPTASGGAANTFTPPHPITTAPADATSTTMTTTTTTSTSTSTPLPLASDGANRRDDASAVPAQHNSESSSHPASDSNTSTQQSATATPTKSTLSTSDAQDNTGTGDQIQEQELQDQHQPQQQQQQQQPQQSVPHRQPTPRKRRFSLMRFRHVSESHLSTVISSGSPSPAPENSNASPSSVSARPSSRAGSHDFTSAKSPAGTAAGGYRLGRKSEGDGVTGSSRPVPADADAPPVPPVPPLPAIQLSVPNGHMQPPPTIITTSPTAGADGAFHNDGRYYNNLNSLDDIQSQSQYSDSPAASNQQQQPSQSPTPSPAPISQWNFSAQWARFQQNRLREKEEREREKAEQQAAHRKQRSTGSFDANAVLSSDGTWNSVVAEREEVIREREGNGEKETPRPLSRSRKLLSSSFNSMPSATIRGKSPRPPTASEWTGSGSQTVREAGSSSRHSFSIPFPFSKSRNGDNNHNINSAHSYREEPPFEPWTVDKGRSSSFDDRRRLSATNLHHEGDDDGLGQDTETLRHGPVVPGRLSTSSARSDRSRKIGGSKSFERERDNTLNVGRGSSIGQGLSHFFSSNNNNNNGNATATTSANADGTPVSTTSSSSPFKSNPFARFARKKRAKTLFPLPARVNGSEPPAPGFGGGGADGNSVPNSGVSSSAVSPESGTPVTGSPQQHASNGSGGILGNISLSLGKHKGRQLQSLSLDRSLEPVHGQTTESDGRLPSPPLTAEPSTLLEHASPMKGAPGAVVDLSRNGDSARVHTPSPTRQTGASETSAVQTPPATHQGQPSTSNGPVHPSVSALFRNDSNRSSGGSSKSIRSLRAPGNGPQHTSSSMNTDKSPAASVNRMSSRRMRSSTVGSMPIPWFGHGGEKHVHIATQTHPKSERTSAESEGRVHGIRYSDETRRYQSHQTQNSFGALSATTADSQQQAVSNANASSSSAVPTGNGSAPAQGPGGKSVVYNNGSTASRKSFGDFFHFSTRMRQNSEPMKFDGHALPSTNEQAHTHGASNAVGQPGTPSTNPSKPNSMSMSREAPLPPPAKEPDDTPATYLLKLESSVPRGSIATILSQSKDPFYAEALRKYMNGFSFFDDPIDMSLRKMLMEVELPKEAQEIDRVLDCFAQRYHDCNPGIFEAQDQAYFIAFSLLMLHTDVFNKNNKRKMQRQDYVRNTSGYKIADEILECFYDNISYTPFIRVEDDATLNTKSLTPSTSAQLRKKLFRVGSADHLSKSSKDPVDPYALILEGRLWTLRPNLKEVMELEDVYNYTSPSYKPDGTALHHAFHKSSILQIVSARSRPDAFRAPESIENPEDSHPGLVAIRVARVGLLWRKDPKKKRARSPWQEWGAVLTGSQLYFFRDVPWVKTLIAQYDNAQKLGRRHGVTFKPPLTDFKPDAIMSTEEAIVLQDASYKRHKHAFLLVRHGGLEEVFLANSETEMNEWMATINYAAAFRTMGVNMRGMIGGQFQGPFETERDRMQKEEDRKDRENGLLPEQSLEHDIDFERTAIGGETQSNASSAVLPTDKVLRRARRVDPCLVEEVSVARRELLSSRIREADQKLEEAQKSLEILLRNARHLQLLTPVHARARDNVLLAAGRISAKIKWARIDIWRTKCYRDILAVDLMDDERQSRSFERAKPLETVEKEEIAQEEERDEGRAAHSSRPSTAGRQNSRKERKRPGSRRSVSSLPVGSPFGRQAFGRRRSSASDQLEWAVKDPESNALALRRAASDSHRQSRHMDDRMHPSQPLVTLSHLKHAHAGSESNDLPQSQSHITSPTHNFMFPASRIRSHSPALPRVIDLQARTSVGKSKKPHRSIQKTLRDAHHTVLSSKPSRKASSGAHSHVSHKGDTDTDSEDKPALSRTPGSFTVHGKKASVVTFGATWDGISPEEGLKMRKPSNQASSQARKDPTSPVSTDDAEFVSAMGSPNPSYLSDLSRTSSSQSERPNNTITSLLTRDDGLSFINSHSRTPSRGMSDSELDTIRGRLQSPRIQELNLPLSLVAGFPPDSAKGATMPPEAQDETTPVGTPSSRPSSFPLIDATSLKRGSTIRLVRDDDDVDYGHCKFEPGPATKGDVADANDDSAIGTNTSEKLSLHTATESPCAPDVSQS